MAKLKKFSIIRPSEKASAVVVLAYAKATKTGLTDNAETFRSPPVTLEAFAAKITELENSMVAKKYSSDATREVTKKLKEEVQGMLAELDIYVMGVGKGDRYITGLSGMQLSKEISETKPQTTIKVKSAMPGTLPGTTDIILSKKGGSEMFKVYLKVGEDYVMHDAFTGVSHTLTNMPGGLTDIRIIGFKGNIKGDVVDVVAKAF